MDTQEFLDYVSENFDISGEAYRLIGNIVSYIAQNFIDEDDQYNAACALLDGTIGLTDNELRQIAF